MRDLQRSKAVNGALFLLYSLFCFLLSATPSLAAESGNQVSGIGSAKDLQEFDAKVLQMAETCRDQAIATLENLLDSNRLRLDQLFDTFYIPIPNTAPQKYSTQYDKVTDQELIGILDSCLAKDVRLIYVVVADINGYVPTHNSKYSMPLTNNLEYNTKNNRTKQLFNDRTGIAAAKNTQPFLLQSYPRDTGKEMFDLSLPIRVKGKHWGALRVGYEH